MDNDEYLTTQFMVVNIAVALKPLELDRFLERIGKTHAIMPVVDPTLYRLAMSQLNDLATIARALKTAQQQLDGVDIDQFVEKS